MNWTLSKIFLSADEQRMIAACFKSKTVKGPKHHTMEVTLHNQH